MLQEWSLPARTLRYVHRSPSTCVETEVAPRTPLPVSPSPRDRDRPPRAAEDSNRFLTAAKQVGHTFSADCTAFATADKTLQLSGNKVYWSAGTGVAWRCVTDARGRIYVLSATSSTGLGDGGLASAVASGLDVSRRTSSVSVALTTKPGIVKRGGTVLVSGVAGGCTAGDQVTIISRAFAESHSFAGVPAVFAQVGSAGRFSTRARIPAARRPGSYLLTARCGGGNLGVSARLAVAA